MAFSLLAARGPRSALYLGVLAFIVAAMVGVLAVRSMGIPPTEAAGPTGQGAMSLSVENHAGSCEDAMNPTKCDLPLGTSFALVVTTDEIPYRPLAAEDNVKGASCSDGQENGDGDGADNKDIDCAGYEIVSSFVDFGNEVIYRESLALGTTSTRAHAPGPAGLLNATDSAPKWSYTAAFLA